MIPARRLVAVAILPCWLAMAGCVACHTVDRPLAGGRAIESPFGTFFSPNITPHMRHGIGAWSDEQFLRALHQGISPSGRHYYPAFPYTSFSRMTREDVLALRAYLMTRPASPRTKKSHDISWPVTSQRLLKLWKSRKFKPAVFAPDPARSAEWNRGAYLANALGHCGECHTPRDPFGALRSDMHLAGNPRGPDGVSVPNITPDRETGIGSWAHADLVRFLASGRRPDGRFSSGIMAEVLGYTCMRMTPDDQSALATYLLSIAPIHHDPDAHTASYPDFILDSE